VTHLHQVASCACRVPTAAEEDPDLWNNVRRTMSSVNFRSLNSRCSTTVTVFSSASSDAYKGLHQLMEAMLVSAASV
jgi:hypothetical protein